MTNCLLNTNIIIHQLHSEVCVCVCGLTVRSSKSMSFSFNLTRRVCMRRQDPYELWEGGVSCDNHMTGHLV